MRVAFRCVLFALCCQSVVLASAVDEVTDLRVTAYDGSTGNLSISWVSPDCNESDHNIELGLLQDVASYGWSDQDCLIGDSGTYSQFAPGPDSYFFVVVANDGISREGAYGVDSAGQTRPDDTIDPVCAFVQEDTDGDGIHVPCDCDDAEPLAFPGNPETCNAVDSDCNGSVDDGIVTDGAGCMDPGLPTFPDPIDTVQVATRTGTASGDSSDGLDLCVCLTQTPGSCGTPCWPLGDDDAGSGEVSDDWDEREADLVDVFTVEGIGVPRAAATHLRFQVSGVPPFDDWTPSCVQVSFDGEPIYCNDAPGVELGDSGTTWEVALTAPSPGCTCFDSKQTHGPMVGAVGPDTARLWVRADATRQAALRIATDAGSLAASEPVAHRYPGPATDFTTAVDVQGLAADTTYFYRYDVDGEVGPVRQFKTAAPEGPTQLSFAFGSCNDRKRFEEWPIFGSILNDAPDLFLFMGDNHYANSSDLDVLRQNYRWAMERADRADLMAQTVSLATWDDHDFVGNNSDGNEPGKAQALRAFKEYWANPAFGCPDAEGCAGASYPGNFFDYRYGDVEFFFGDSRYWRDVTIDPVADCPGPLQPAPSSGWQDPSLLGRCQTQWLVDRLLASNATFKILVTGSQWTTEGGSDSWGGYEQAQRELMQFIADNGIEGVVFLSGDKHRAEFRRLAGGGDARFTVDISPGTAKGYTLPELGASPLARDNHCCHPSNELLTCRDSGNLTTLEGEQDVGLFYQLIHVDTTLPDPTLTARVHDLDGNLVDTWTIHRSELANPTPVATGSRPDFNGDGYADVTIGLPGEDIGALSDAGAFHVLYGSSVGLHSLNDALWHQDSGEVKGISEIGDDLGAALTTGDFDGDGFDDAAAGAPGDLSGAGSVNVIYGSAAGLDPEETAENVGDQEWNQDEPGVSGGAEAGDSLGAALAAGDFNDDGFDDLAVGVPGEDSDEGVVQVFYGAATTGLDLAAGPGQQSWDQSNTGATSVAASGDTFGRSLAVGDFNDDGFDDLAIGIPGKSSGAGLVTVLYGSVAGLTSTGDQEWSQDSAGIEDTSEAGDAWGASLATGDVDRDGFDELIVGVPPGEDLGAAVGAGRFAVLYGSATGLVAAGDQSWHLDSAGVGGSAASGDGLGTALAVADFDGDGFEDVAAGIPGATVAGRNGAGSALVLYGTGSGLDVAGQQLVEQDVAITETPETGDSFGAAMTSGDFNADGYTDLAVGVPGEDLRVEIDEGPGGSCSQLVLEARSDSGLVNVFHGSASGLVIVAPGAPLSLTELRDQRWHPALDEVSATAETGDSFGAALP